MINHPIRRLLVEGRAEWLALLRLFHQVEEFRFLFIERRFSAPSELHLRAIGRSKNLNAMLLALSRAISRKKLTVLEICQSIRITKPTQHSYVS
jgi:hypothetical protein